MESNHKIFNTFEKQYYEFRIYLIGESLVGKQSIINKISQMPSTKTIQPENNSTIEIKIQPTFKNKLNSQKDDSKSISKESLTKKSLSTVQIQIKNEKEDEKYKTHPAENSAKLFNINNTKLIFKPFYIPPAENLPFNYESLDENSDCEIENDEKISFKLAKNFITQNITNKNFVINEKKLSNYKINIENVFLFIFDLSDFKSFERIILYYNSISRAFHFDDEDTNISAALIGNKLDKKIFFNYNQQETFNKFITKCNLNYYEISTFNFFNFEKFFYNLFEDLFNFFFENVFFSNDFKDLLKNRPNFSKAKRTIKNENENFPGPKYNIDIFGINSDKEKFDALNNSKTRFNKKIFINKTGPIFHKSKSDVNINDKKNLHFITKNFDDNFNNINNNFNNKIKGFTLGTVQGKLNLKFERNEKKKEIDQKIKSSFDLNEISDLFLNIKTNKNEDYFNLAKKRKEQIQQNLFNEKKIRLNKIKEIHEKNLQKINEIKQNQIKNIFLNQKIVASKSSPDLLTIEDKNTFEKDNKNRYYNVLFSNNKKHIEKKVDKNLLPNYNFITPGPNAYDISGNLLNPSKGKTILGKRKEPIHRISNVSFPNIKSDFEKIVENNMKKSFVSYGDRFKFLYNNINVDNENKKYINEDKWKKWEENKKDSEKEKRILFFLKDRLNKMKLQKEKKKKEDEFKENKIENLQQKFGENIQINYSQVETSSPKFSIIGRHFQKNEYENNNNNLMIGSNFDNNENIEKNNEIIFNNPNFNAIKTSYPAFSFAHEKRFKDFKENDENNFNDLFVDGNFGEQTRKDFSKKEPYSLKDKRGIKKIIENFPGPGEYKIKTSFEEIVQKGLKINQNNQKNINEK